jgi:cytochrome c nitrite reductase small subunit
VHNKIFTHLIPPDNWKLPVVVIIGILTGLIFFTVYAGKATSYLSDKPETCINCHVMYSQFDSWQHSSHARVANCNDCHVPHNNIFSKYYFKATDGLRHSTIFTFRLEPQVIRIKNAGKEVVQENCERCHEGLLSFHETFEALMNGGKEDEANERLCWDCHRDIPHGRVNSLSSAPNAQVIFDSPIIPVWLENRIELKEK